MRKSLFILSILLLNIAISFGKTWTVISKSNYTFSPATLTITFGDTVVFNINMMHNVVEVSQATWNANDSTQLTGGFSLSDGGGKLTGIPVGTHYYVCHHHVGMYHMKGIITVDPASGIQNITGINVNSLNIYPNPSLKNFKIDFTLTYISNIEISLMDFTGKTVKTIVSKQQTPGHYTLDIENKNLYGTYFIKLTDNKNVIIRKILIL